MMDPKPIKRPGRPRNHQQKTSLSTWVPVECYDRLARVARNRNESVSAVVARVLVCVVLPPPEKTGRPE